MDQERDFKTQFNEALSGRGISIGKLAELSGVPERYIEAFHTGNPDNLPPAPYVRGYLSKLASVLNANSEEFWRGYKAEYGGKTKTSGTHDKLPENRYSLKKLNKSRISAAIVIMLFAVYGVLRFNEVIGRPSIKIQHPSIATLVVAADRITVAGEVTPGDRLILNGEPEQLSETGRFEREIRLFPGINTFEFKVKRPLGGETIEHRKIIYEPAHAPSSSPRETGQ